MMNKITITNNSDIINIIVDNVKLICGDDYEAKDRIKKVLINQFNKMSISEYGEEHYETSLKINDEPINLNDYKFYYIDSNFDFLQDAKMGSKSLCLEYVEALFEQIEYKDAFQTINMLFNDILEEVLENENYEITPIIDFELTKKIIFKIISLAFLKDDFIINNYDLSLNERLMLQINMIKRISMEATKNIIILLDSPFLASEIYDKLQEIKGIKLIIFEKTTIPYVSDLLVLDKIRVDTLDDNEIYELCNNNQTTFYTINEMREKIMVDHFEKRILK